MTSTVEDNAYLAHHHTSGCGCAACQAREDQAQNAGSEDSAAAGGPNIFGTKWGADDTLGTSGGVVTWSMPPVGSDISIFDVNPTVSVDGADTYTFDFEAAIKRAFAAWSEVANIEFVQVEETADTARFDQADIRVHFAPIEGSTLGLGFFPGDSEFPSAGGDILLDTDASLNRRQSDFDALILHELGHALGLDHVDQNADSVLTPFLSATELRPLDIQGARQIYGAQDNAPAVLDLRAFQDDINIVDSIANLTVNGNAFDNVIDGTGSAETFRGEEGDDRLIGRGGRDNLEGGAGLDTLSGGLGRDRLDGGAEADRLSGGSGADRLSGGTGNDMLLGGAGADALLGDADMDTLNGGGQDDSLFGGTGNDVLLGGAARDRLAGQAGDDRLNGGGQGDTLIGGAGSDTFIFSGAHGRDRITDFDANDADERISLRRVDGFDTFQDVQDAATQVRNDVRIDTGDGTFIRLQGVDLSDLDASDFIF